MRYKPCASVTTVRTCSIKAGLLAWMVTPGSTAPDWSRTRPVRLLCAHAAAGTTTRPHTATDAIRSDFIRPPAMSTIRVWRLSHGFAAARRGLPCANLRSLYDIDQAVVLFVAGEF